MRSSGGAVVASILFASGAFAVPQVIRRDVSVSAGIPSGTPVTTLASEPTATLTPTVAPAVNQNDLDILTPGKSVTLYYSNSSPNSKKRDTTTDTTANLAFTFKYPSVPLDHSAYISSITCAGDGTLEAVFGDTDAFSAAESAWSDLANLILITAVTGCGTDEANDYFLATSFDFNEDTKIVKATGSSTTLAKIVATLDLKWGQSSSKYGKVKRDDPDYSFSIGTSFDIGTNSLIDPSAEDAPWDNAFLLASWTNDGEESADATGDGNEKRAIAQRGVEAGINLYCVDCGINGDITLSGGLSYSFWDADITECYVSINGDMTAGLYLGLEMFAKYTKEWEKELLKQNLLGWSILDIISVGPYISLGVSASFEVGAEGEVLVGAAAVWDNWGATLNVLSPSDSSIYGLVPTVESKFDASGKISAEASLGLPMGIGVGIDLNIIDLITWNADIALVDTPSITAEASFELGVSGSTNSAGIDVDINGGCLGVAWEIGLENQVSVDFFGDDYPIGDPWESGPIYSGCFGEQLSSSAALSSSTSAPIASVSQPTVSASATPAASVSDTVPSRSLPAGSIANPTPSSPSESGPTTAPTTPACTPSAHAVPNKPYSSKLLCNKGKGHAIRGQNAVIDGPFHVPFRQRCAKRCLEHHNCRAWGFQPEGKMCTLYKKHVGSVQCRKGDKIRMYDRGCFKWNTCENAEEQVRRALEGESEWLDNVLYEHEE